MPRSGLRAYFEKIFTAESFGTLIGRLVRFLLYFLLRFFEFSGIFFSILVTIGFFLLMLLPQAKQMYSNVLEHSNFGGLLVMFVCFAFFHFFVLLTTIYNRGLSENDLNVFFGALFVLPMILIGVYSITLALKFENWFAYYSHAIILVLFMGLCFWINQVLVALSDNQRRNASLIRSISLFIIAMDIALGVAVLNKDIYSSLFYNAPSLTIVIYVFYAISIRGFFFYIWLFLVERVMSRMRLLQMKSNQKFLVELGQLIYFTIVLGLIISSAIWMYRPRSTEKAVQKNSIITRPLQSPLSSVSEYDYAFLHKISKDTVSTPIYLMAGQGGGSRAAATISQIMYRLDQDPTLHFYDRIYAISAISGSTTGAAQYLVQKEHALTHPDFIFSNQTDKLYSYDFVSPTFYNLLFKNTINNLLWFSMPFRFDRNQELAYDEAYNLERLTLGQDYLITRDQNDPDYEILPYWYTPINEYYVGSSSADRVRHPMLISNSYDVMSHTPIVAAPFQMKNLVEESIDITSLLAEEQRTLSIGTSVGISQYFPMINDLGYYQTEDRLYSFYDGGIYDNLALESTEKIYNHLRRLLDDNGLEEKPIKILAIKNLNIYKLFPPPLNEAEALTSGTVSSILYAHQQQDEKDLISALQSPHDDYISFDCFLPEDKKDITLSRWLTADELKTIERLTSQEIEKNRGRLD